MHICLISNDLFAWGRATAAGYATRLLGEALVAQGAEVTAVVPRGVGQAPVEQLAGMRVLSYAPRDWRRAWQLLRAVAADVYHAQSPSLGAYLAQKAVPNGIHLLTFHNGRSATDWARAAQGGARLSLWAERLASENWVMQEVVRRTNGRFVSARQLTPKIRQTYRLGGNPDFLPTPVAAAATCQKAAQPTVCYVGRWDEPDHTELFFELARLSPQIHFIAVGHSQTEKQTAYWRKTYASLPNVEIHDWLVVVASGELAAIWQKSWIFVDTATHHGLPATFIEAAAHGCAILGVSNPDNFAKDFGFLAQQYELVTGLQTLLTADRWRTVGEKGQAYVRQVFEPEIAAARYWQTYERLLRWQRRQKPIRRPLASSLAYRNGGNLWP